VKRTIKRKIGDVGEGVACKYLERKGFRVLERNYLKPWGEIDIVAEKGQMLRFVEVKTVSRENGSRGTGQGIRPEENMHPGKLRRLHRAVQTYLLDRHIPEDKPWQIDLACVFLDFSARRAKVEMFENVIL
jgi:putative endonuclease